MTFAPALGQAGPIAQQGDEYKDSSPHFDRVEALTALIGTIVSQLFQAGAPFSDTIGNFRPIVISSGGITVNTSATHPSTLRFHATDVSTTDMLLWANGFPASSTKQVVWGREDPSNTTIEYDWQNTDGSVQANTAKFFMTIGGTPLGAILSSVVNATVRTIYSTLDSKLGDNNIVFANKVKAGAPIDGDYTAPGDGMMVFDNTNGRLYVRSNGTWAYTGLSATGVVTTPASTTSTAGLKVPHGSAPSSPVNGDMWTTTTGLFIRINGATVGPLT